MAKINTKIICLRSGAFSNFPSKIYKTSMKHYKYMSSFQYPSFLKHNVLNVSLPEYSVERLLTWSQFRKRQALRSGVKETRSKSSKVNFAA